MISNFTILSDSGEFSIPEELRRDCVFLSDENNSCFEYATEDFRADIGNKYLHVRRALIRKYQSVSRVKSTHKEIADFYDQNSIDLHKSNKSETEDKKPLENSRREFLSIITRAAKEGAVDIHFIVRKRTARVLFRIHGGIERFDEFNFSPNHITGLLGAMYGEAKDGSDNSFSPRLRSSCTLLFSNPPVSLRWQNTPTGDADGEEFDVTCRITKQDFSETDKIKSLSELGFLPDQVDLLSASVNTPGGIILSGITGSGKTTALRSLMQMTRGTGDKKIYTVEDPIELKIFGATQINARGNNMSSILKGLLRADPDVIMVGEVRDGEVANVMQDVLRSGHKMMTTVHAPSAFGIISRFASKELGIHRETLVEPGFIAALVYQYLMPTLCPHCKIPAKEQPERIAHIAPYLFSPNKFDLNIDNIFLTNSDKGNSCPHCRRGVSGMTICAEVIRLNYDIIRYIRDKKDAEALNAYRSLRSARFDESDTLGKTAYEIAIYKISQGLIDPNKVNDTIGAMSLYEPMAKAYDTALIPTYDQGM